MSNLVHNEQVKLRATFLNNVGVVAFAGGVVGPTFGDVEFGVLRVFFFAAGTIMGFGLQTAGHRMLQHLQE